MVPSFDPEATDPESKSEAPFPTVTELIPSATEKGWIRALDIVNSHTTVCICNLMVLLLGF